MVIVVGDGDDGDDGVDGGDDDDGDVTCCLECQET